jgi:hypothetical protein
MECDTLRKELATLTFPVRQALAEGLNHMLDDKAFALDTRPAGGKSLFPIGQPGFIYDVKTNFYNVGEAKRLIQDTIIKGCGGRWDAVSQRWTLKDTSNPTSGTLSELSIDEIVKEAETLESRLNDILSRPLKTVDSITREGLARLEGKDI